MHGTKFCALDRPWKIDFDYLFEFNFWKRFLFTIQQLYLMNSNDNVYFLMQDFERTEKSPCFNTVMFKRNYLSFIWLLLWAKTTRWRKSTRSIKPSALMKSCGKENKTHICLFLLTFSGCTLLQLLSYACKTISCFSTKSCGKL